MKKNLRNLGLGMLSVLAIAFTSCDKDDDNAPAQKNLLQTVQTDPQFATLAKALKVTNLEGTLSGTAKFTLFAPTNTAFAALEITPASLDTQTPAQLESLKNILLNHVITDTKLSASLATGYVKTNASFGTTTSKLSLYVSVTGTTTKTVKLNNLATVTKADITASNGVLHTVDKVILLPTIATFATADSNFSTLTGLVSGAGLVPTLSGTEGAPFTVFAPSNAAFTDFNTQNPNVLAGLTTDQVYAVLTYHVVGGLNVLSTGIPTTPIPTLESGTFTIAGTTITDERQRQTGIVAVDVQASNGVIHVINNVLLPQF